MQVQNAYDIHELVFDQFSPLINESTENFDVLLAQYKQQLRSQKNQDNANPQHLLSLYQAIGQLYEIKHDYIKAEKSYKKALIVYSNLQEMSLSDLLRSYKLIVFI